jgi:hypothetical protein
MLEIKEENIKGLEMSFTLDEREAHLLAAFAVTEPFHILQRLMEQEIRLMNVKLMNSSDPQEIITNHSVAKASGMFYIGVMQRLQEILSIETVKAAGIGTAENPEVPSMLDEVS